MKRPWLHSYPPSVPYEIDVDLYSSINDLFEQAFIKHKDKTAYICLGAELTYAQVDAYSKAIAMWLQSLNLAAGTRVALMLPNCFQYPVSLMGIWRAGLTAVNVNPLYTAPELHHQLKDSGAEVIIAFSSFAPTIERAKVGTAVKQVVLTRMGDLFPGVKGLLTNFVLKYIKKLEPSHRIEDVVSFKSMIREFSRVSYRRATVKSDDLALLQYTGGTTGVSKGAMLLHRNITANVLQSYAWMYPAVVDPKKPSPPEQMVMIAALPFYHIFGLTVCCLLGMHAGLAVLLIPNPRDIKAFVEACIPVQDQITFFPAVNTLFNALLNDPSFAQLRLPNLRVSMGAGMAVQQVVAERWLAQTGCPICEGYGLSETSPSAIANPTDTDVYSGTIGVPLPSTDVMIIDELGHEVPLGQAGEIAIKGPQLMAGYWQQPEQTANVMTPDGYFKTGDIAIMNERGFIKIVDRKKDMILVSGFNVYPNEIENIVAQLDGVLECAAVGVPDEKSGEAVKLFVVKRSEALTEHQIIEHCKAHLTGYKRPRSVQFIDKIPKSNVGKILRRELRDHIPT